MTDSDKRLASLCADRMTAICEKHGCDIDVFVLPSVDSTNTWLLQKDACEKLTLCVAEHQTVGRGRRGKPWFSPDGGVTFSVRLDSEQSVSSFNGLSLLVGSLLCDHLRALGVNGAMIKWPNDVLVGDAKLAGILIESLSAASETSQTTVVIGMGINYKRGQEAGLIDQTSTDLFELCGRNLPPRSDLIAEITSTLCAVLAGDVPSAVRVLSERWSDFDALQQRELVVEHAGTQHVGITDGIEPDGALRLVCGSEVRIFTSADIASVRRL